MAIRVILYDLDGVLVDACGIHFDALNDALFSVARFKISEQEHAETFNGLPTTKKLSILVNEGRLTKDQAGSVYTEKQRRTTSIINEKVEPRPEKIEMMKTLKEKGIRIGCVTNCSEDTAIMMLKRSEIWEYFNVIVTNRDVTESKPDPEGYLTAIRLLKANPEETMIIEDSPKGFTAAVRAGVKYTVKVDGVDEVDWPLIERVTG